jgi:serine protease
MNKKGNVMKKLLIFFVIIAILFGIYSLFFSEKAKNMGYYIDRSIKLISYDDLRKTNIREDHIDDLIVMFNDKLSVEEIKEINHQFNLSNLLTDFIDSISGKENQEYNVYIYEDLLVNFEDNVTEEQIKAIEEEYNINLRLNSSYSDKDKLFIFRNTNNQDSFELIRMLNKLTDESIIEYAQPSYLYSIPEQFGKESGGASSTNSNTGIGISKEKPWIPNDPMYKEQWNFEDINTGLAWTKTKGKDAVVAVIDTGVSSKGEDLEQSRFVEGYNFVKNNKDATDDHGHGTHVAGTIAQTTNNGKGVAGVAPEARIMPLKVLNKNGFGNLADIAEAIKWSADHGANVINMSLGGGGRNQVMEDAVKYAQKKGVVVVAAAGNENRNKASYPAYYKGVVSVASYGPDGKRAFYSNYGDGVRISAPGGSDRAGKGHKGKILQETLTGYEWFQGTSMASPHVAGVAALIHSAGVKDADKIIDILYKSAHKVDGDNKNEFGAGKVDAKEAVYKAKGISTGDGGELNMSTTNLFIYIAAAIIAMIVFFMWYNRMNSLSRVYELSFLPFFIGIVISTVGFIIPALFASNTLTALLSSSLPHFDNILFGVMTPLFHSALIPILFVLLFSGSKGLRSFAVAVAVGFATVLIVDALILFDDVAIIPNLTGIQIIDRLFLLFNALISALFGMAAVRRAV